MWQSYEENDMSRCVCPRKEKEKDFLRRDARRQISVEAQIGSRFRTISHPKGYQVYYTC